MVKGSDDNGLFAYPVIQVVGSTDLFYRQEAGAQVV